MSAEKRKLILLLVASAGVGVLLCFYLSSFLVGTVFGAAIWAVCGAGYLLLEKSGKDLQFRRNLSLREREGVMLAVGFSSSAFTSMLGRGVRFEDLAGDDFPHGFLLSYFGIPIVVFLVWLIHRTLNPSDSPEEIGLQNRFDAAEVTQTGFNDGADEIGSQLV